MMNTATKISAQSDELAARRTADAIVHLLQDFIPHACQREASLFLANAAFQEGWELTNKAMRKEYEAWKKLTLDTMPFGGIQK